MSSPPRDHTNCKTCGHSASDLNLEQGCCSQRSRRVSGLLATLQIVISVHQTSSANLTVPVRGTRTDCLLALVSRIGKRRECRGNHTRTPPPCSLYPVPGELATPSELWERRWRAGADPTTVCTPPSIASTVHSAPFPLCKPRMRNDIAVLTAREERTSSLAFPTWPPPPHDCPSPPSVAFA